MLADVSQFRSQAKDEMTMRGVALPNDVADASIIPASSPQPDSLFLSESSSFLGSLPSLSAAIFL